MRSCAPSATAWSASSPHRDRSDGAARPTWRSSRPSRLGSTSSSPTIRSAGRRCWPRCEPDLIISGGFPWRIPADVLALPRLGAINFHDALLPRHRGPNATGWAFRMGDAETGLTIHRLTPEFDTGPVLAQARVPITDDDNLSTLMAQSWTTPRHSCARRWSGWREATRGSPGREPGDRGRAVRGRMADHRLESAGTDHSQPGAQLGRAARHPAGGARRDRRRDTADHQDPPAAGRADEAGASATGHGRASGWRTPGRAMWRRTDRDLTWSPT